MLRCANLNRAIKSKVLTKRVFQSASQFRPICSFVKRQSAVSHKATLHNKSRFNVDAYIRPKSILYCRYYSQESGNEKKNEVSTDSEFDELESLLDEYRKDHASGANNTTDGSHSALKTEAQQLFGRASTQAEPLKPPPLPITGDVDCRWIRNGDMNNPFNFDILDVSDVIAVTPAEHVAPGNTDANQQSASELALSYRHLASQILPSQGTNVQQPKPEDIKLMKSSQKDMEKAMNTGGRPQDNYKQHSVSFDPPLVVRVPLLKSQFQDVSTTFASKPVSSTQSELDLPSMRSVQRADNSGGRYDVYIAGQETISLFFATTTSIAMRDSLPADGTVAIERHHVITLSSLPKVTRVLPPHIDRMIKQSNDVDPLHGYIEFRCSGVTSTFDMTDKYGSPASDLNFRRREVDFLIRNVIFGITLPAPLPPTFYEALQLDLEGEYDSDNSQRWRETAGRYTVGMYGHSSVYASIASPLDHPSVHREQLDGQPYLLMMYDDPKNIFGSDV